MRSRVGQPVVIDLTQLLCTPSNPTCLYRQAQSYFSLTLDVYGAIHEPNRNLVIKRDRFYSIPRNKYDISKVASG